MTAYYRLMLGKGGSHLKDAITENWIGVDFDLREDLSDHLPDDWRAFNAEFIPKWLAVAPGKTKVAAGLACGGLWTVAKGINVGDLVISPDGQGMYYVGTVSGPYQYVPDSPLPHRRPVRWNAGTFPRAKMSDAFKLSTSSVGTVTNITKFSSELETLIADPTPPELIASDPSVEDATVFALEKHLEDFLVANWGSTPLGKTHKIYEVDGERVGQQFLTDTGPIDILAQSHDGQELLVVELKRGRASDTVVGQIQRYMGYVAEVLAEDHQTVRGIIIALEDDLKVRRALAVAPSIDFYRYQVSFTLMRT